jgi:hypothetical protein
MLLLMLACRGNAGFAAVKVEGFDYSLGAAFSLLQAVLRCVTVSNNANSVKLSLSTPSPIFLASSRKREKLRLYKMWQTTTS